MKPDPSFAAFFGIYDPELAEWTNARLTPNPWKCYSQKLQLRNEAAMRAIPESHIICTSTIRGRDMTTLKARSDGRVWDVDVGHDLMLIRPDKVAEILLSIVT